MPEAYIYTPPQTLPSGEIVGGYYSISAIQPEQTIFAVSTPQGITLTSPTTAVFGALGQHLETGIKQSSYYFGAGLSEGAGAAGAALGGLTVGSIILLLAAVYIATR